jgi:hypothetical protein
MKVLDGPTYSTSQVCVSFVHWMQTPHRNKLTEITYKHVINQGLHFM